MTQLSTDELKAMGFVPSDAVKEAAKKLASGEEQLNKEADPTPDEQDFLVHVLGGKPFQKVFEYFGGKVSITVRSLTAADEEICARNAAAIPPTASALEHVRLFREYRMLMAVYTITVEGQAPVMLRPSAAEDISNLEKYRTGVIAKLNGPVYGVLNDAYSRFENVYNTLMTKSTDPSFWKTGG